jgi:hypothetical protein
MLQFTIIAASSWGWRYSYRMNESAETLEREIAGITTSHGCGLYGFADVKGLPTKELAQYPRAISFVFQMEPWVMDELSAGPTDAYSVLYEQVNRRIDALAVELKRAL